MSPPEPGLAVPPSSRSFLQRILGRADADEVRTALSEVGSPDAAIALGNKVILFGFILFLGWAAYAPLDEGVTASGNISVESMRKVISSFNGGTIGKIHVHENDMVKAGQPLITLDQAKARNAYDTVLQEFLAASAKHARLSAESTFGNDIVFPKELVAQAEEAGRMDILQGQERLFAIRQNALNNELAVLRQTLSASNVQVKGARDQLAAKLRERSLLAEEVTNTRPLAESGYVARNRLLELERNMSIQDSATHDLETRIAREMSSGSEIQLRINQRRKEYLKEAESQLADTDREVSTLRERLDDARRELAKTEIKAPVSGQVIAFQLQTIGAVVSPGMKIMELVPEDEKLLLDVKIPPHLIDKIHTGLLCHVRFAAFVDRPELVVEGKVQSLSHDKHDSQSSAPGTLPSYYLARVEVTEKGMTDLKGRQLRPGMPVDVVVKTGERSLLAYLMKPIVRPLFNAFQEP